MTRFLQEIKERPQLFPWMKEPPEAMKSGSHHSQKNKNRTELYVTRVDFVACLSLMGIHLLGYP